MPYVALVTTDIDAPLRRPIVGRGAELDIVVDHVRSHGQVLIAGEAGIGKSTLLDAVAGRLQDDGFDVYRVAGTQALVDHPLAALGHLIGDPGNRSGPALASFAADRLKSLARGSQAVIVADDAHALDPWSLHVIAQVRSDDGPRSVLAARRTSAVPDSVTAFGRHPGLTLEMQRLSQSETAELAAQVLQAPMDTPSVSRVHQATDGLPLAIVELVRYAVRRGVLVERSGLYRWDTSDVVDRHLAELLGLRIDELGVGERDVVDALSIVGEMPMDLVSRLAPDVSLDDLERQRLIRSAPRPGWVTVAHPLLRDASSAILAPVRRRELLGRLVSSLGDRLGDDAELVRLRVVLAIEVGAPVRSNDLIEAARWARTHQLWEPMQAVFERAWEDVPGPETGLWFGEALYWTRRMPEAEAVLAAGELVCTTDAERVALATVRARTLEIGLGRPSEAEALRQSRLDSVSDPAARLEMACAQCERWMFDGEIDQVLAVLASARDLSAMGHVDAAFDASRYRLTQSTVGALGLNGQFAEMTAEYQLHLQLAIDHELTHPLAREVVDPWWVSGNLTAGRIDTVVDVISDRYATALAVGDGLSRPLWALPQAIERWLAGDLVAAEHFAREAMGVPAAVVSIRRMATHYLARILELAGRYDEALAHARSTVGNDYVGIVRSWGAGIEYRCEMGSSAVLLPSDRRRLAARVHDAIDGAIERGQLITAAYVAHDVVGYDHGIDVAATLSDLAARTDAPSVRWMSAHASVLAGDGVDALLDAVHESNAAGCHGLTERLASAAVDVAVGRRDTTAAAVATALLQQCRSQTTGFAGTSRQPGVFDAFGLSTREREIARAATAGLTDHDIAAELYISVRTVNAHLRTIYRKLGINGRRELPVG